MHLVVFEDDRWPDLAPLTFSRPAFALSVGATTLLHKQIRFLEPTRLSLWVRPQLEDFCKRFVVPGLDVPVTVNQPLDEKPAMLCNGRALFLKRAERASSPMVEVDQHGAIAQAWVSSPGLSPMDCLTRSAAWLRMMDMPKVAAKTAMMEYPWDLIYRNEESLAVDAGPWRHSQTSLPPGSYHVVGERNIFLGTGVAIAPGTVLDAAKGPILVEDGASIGANCVIKGPCCIGRESAITPLSYIHDSVSIGPHCKIGGEVANTIVLGFSNKVHDGFLGHSYLGEWVNLGAGTTTSNLKNTYGPMRMQMGNRQIETGKQFLGSIIGDHTKTAIGTRLMGGTYLGYCCLLASSQLPPKFVPSFTYLTDKGSEPYLPQKARQVMAQVFARRKRTWTEEDEKLVDYVQETAAGWEK